MKRKQLLKKTRDIPEDVIIRSLEHNGRHVSDYFLVGEDGNYIQGNWGPDGKPQTWLVFSEDETGDFAVEQFLLRHVPVFRTEEEVPDRVSEPADIAADEPPKLKPLLALAGSIPEGWKDAVYDERR